jgi:hypothetical protein
MFLTKKRTSQQQDANKKDEDKFPVAQLFLLGTYLLPPCMRHRRHIHVETKSKARQNGNWPNNIEI